MWRAKAGLCAAISGIALAGCAAHHTTTGVVVSTTAPSTVTISHDPFPGYMDAMTMPFELGGEARRVRLTPR